jgi:hypothetical protein
MSGYIHPALGPVYVAKCCHGNRYRAKESWLRKRLDPGIPKEVREIFETPIEAEA